MRIGIVGTGSMGKNHLRVVDSMPELQLTSAMDINADNLRSACDGYPIKTFDNLEEMLPLVDGVMISTPTESHGEIARFFLEHRKNILVEKPFTQTIEEADQLIEMAKNNGCTVAVGHLERFNPAVEYIKNRVKQPLFIEIQRLGPFSPRSLDVDVIMDLMIHDIDIILQWDQTPIAEIHASGVPIISDKIDIATVRLKFASGLVANLTASRVSQKKTRKLRIFQKNTYFSIDYKKKRVKAYRLLNREIVEDIPEIADVEPLYNLWKNFYATITGGKNYNVTAEEARNALQVAIRIRDSIEIPQV
jgi:predicted dehydrogenase